jgi:putative transposase
MLNLNIEVEGCREPLKRGSAKREKKSLKRYLLEKMQQWINSLLAAERDEFLGRPRYGELDEQQDNYRNGYRPRRLNFFGLGRLDLKIPRDRKGELESAWLAERKAQDPETEAFLAEAFLAGLSTRDLARLSEK